MRFTNKLFNRIVGLHFDYFVAQKTYRTKQWEMWIPRGRTGRIYAHVHRPDDDKAYPGIIFVPGGLSPGTDYDKRSAVTADDVSSLGFVVLHYDPSGRGRSNGKENYWGREQQKELIDILNYFKENIEVKKDRIGIFSFSIGICIAAGALSQKTPPFVSYIYDWEGPSNRFNITKNDTFAPLRGFPSSNTSFWKEREPIWNIDRIQCGYFRYQAAQDHMQGSNKKHALELVNRASQGRARWTRMNDNPPNILYQPRQLDHYHWISARCNHKGQMLRYLIEIESGACSVQNH